MLLSACLKVRQIFPNMALSINLHQCMNYNCFLLSTDSLQHTNEECILMLMMEQAWYIEMIKSGEMEQLCWNNVFARTMEGNQSSIADPYCR